MNHPNPLGNFARNRLEKLRRASQNSPKSASTFAKFRDSPLEIAIPHCAAKTGISDRRRQTVNGHAANGDTGSLIKLKVDSGYFAGSLREGECCSPATGTWTQGPKPDRVNEPDGTPIRKVLSGGGRHDPAAGLSLGQQGPQVSSRDGAGGLAYLHRRLLDPLGLRRKRLHVAADRDDPRMRLLHVAGNIVSDARPFLDGAAATRDPPRQAAALPTVDHRRTVVDPHRARSQTSQATQRKRGDPA